MTDELMIQAAPNAPNTLTGPAFDPQAAQAAANAADFAGLIGGDADATSRYVESLLRLVELVDDAGRLLEVLPLWP